MTISAVSLDYIYPPAIILPLAEREKAVLGLGIAISSFQSAITREIGKFANLFAKLSALEIDQDLWLDGVEPPNEFARIWAYAFLQQLQKDDLLPTGITPSAEAGVGIYFIDGDKYADIECLNSGAILGVISNRRDRPFAWEVEQDARGLARASARITEFLNTPAPRKDDSRWSWRRSIFSRF